MLNNSEIGENTVETFSLPMLGSAVYPFDAVSIVH